MNLSSAPNIFDGISQIIEHVDPASVRLISDRVLIRDLAGQEQESVNGIIIPEVAREKTTAGKDGRLRLGVVVAIGPGDRFIECGLDENGNVRRRLITCPCPCKGERRRWFDIRNYRYVDLSVDEKCPDCGDTGRIPVTVPPQCSPGQTVLYDRRRETEFYLEDGQRYSLVHAEQSVLGVVEDESYPPSGWTIGKRFCCKRCGSRHFGSHTLPGEPIDGRRGYICHDQFNKGCRESYDNPRECFVEEGI